MELMSNDLVTLMTEWINARPATRNLSMLSRQSGVPYPTLRRVANLENVPTLETIMSLLGVVASPEQSMRFLQNHAPDMARVIGRMQVEGPTISGVQIQEEYRDRVSFAVFAMAGVKGGTSDTEVQQKFGDYGTTKIARLLDLGALVREGDRLYKAARGNDIDIRVTLDRIRHTVDLFQMEQVGSPGVCAQLHADGLSDDGVKLLGEALSVFLDDVQLIAKRNPGPNAMMFGLVSSFLGVRGKTDG
jgi:hypothetical protein